MKLTDEWLRSNEYNYAKIDWIGRLTVEQPFDHSQEFANARQAYRKRMNG